MDKQQQRNPAKEPKTTKVANEELSKVSGGAFNAFANFGDINGESTDKDHRDWVMNLYY